jgi:hypothetical protein
MVELHSVTTLELRCLFIMVNKNKYTPVADIVDYFTNVSVLGLDHFVHAHILHEEPDYFVPMLYGHKAIQLPNPFLRLYSCESHTL